MMRRAPSLSPLAGWRSRQIVKPSTGTGLLAVGTASDENRSRWVEGRYTGTCCAGGREDDGDAGRFARNPESTICRESSPPTCNSPTDRTTDNQKNRKRHLPISQKEEVNVLL